MRHPRAIMLTRRRGRCVVLSVVVIARVPGIPGSYDAQEAIPLLQPLSLVPGGRPDRMPHVPLPGRHPLPCIRVKREDRSITELSERRPAFVFHIWEVAPDKRGIAAILNYRQS